MAASGCTAAVEKHDGATDQLPLAVPWAYALLIVGAALPLFVPVDTNVNVIATATLTVFIGCRRSVKPDPPEDSMSQKVWHTRRLHPLRRCLKHSAIDNISVVLLHAGSSRCYSHAQTLRCVKALQGSFHTLSCPCRTRCGFRSSAALSCSASSCCSSCCQRWVRDAACMVCMHMSASETGFSRMHACVWCGSAAQALSEMDTASLQRVEVIRSALRVSNHSILRYVANAMLTACFIVFDMLAPEAHGAKFQCPCCGLKQSTL